jgi:hypothetical protein
MSAVVPLRMIIFQCLFLLMAVALEGYVLQRRLAITPRKSIEYAASVNLLSTLVGWLAFFSAEANLPLNIRLQFMNFVFFNQLSGGMASWLIPSGFVTFFVSFFLKLQGLVLLQRLLEVPQQDSERLPRFPGLDRRQPTRVGVSKEAVAVLFANSLSYSSIALILFTRFLIQ